MIDRKARDELANLLEQQLRGKSVSEQSDELAMTGSDDPVIRAMLNKDLDLPLDSAGNLLLATQAAQRKLKMIERCILFLRTDREYQWERTDLPWWTLLLLPLVLAGLVLMMALAFAAAEPIAAFFARLGLWIDFFAAFLFVCAVGAALLYLLGQRLLGAETRCWPFYRRRDYVEALDHDPWTS